MYILGLNQYHADSSAALIKDGKVIAAVEEERFNRKKHWSGFPLHSIEYCLNSAGILYKDLAAVCSNRDPNANIGRKLLFVLRNATSPSFVLDRYKNRKKIKSLKEEFCSSFNIDCNDFDVPFYSVEHHRAHLASSFLASPFDESALLSIDGFGDFCSTMLGVGRANKMSILSSVYFPHSLGLYYLACTQFLGFPNYGDEYKVMGLSAYGRPVYLDQMRRLVSIKNNGLFALKMDMFTHHKELEMSWNNMVPTIGCVFSSLWEKLLGPARKPEEPLEQRHKDIAASVQACYEEVFFNILTKLYSMTGLTTLCLAGGCALNSLANGKIFERSSFKDVYIQPAAGDAGGAIGAALYYYNCIFGSTERHILDNAYLGPSFSNDDVRCLLEAHDSELKAQKTRIERVADEEILCTRVSAEIAKGRVVGWFQDRMEWGPRALGNRSIVCDPRRANMKDILNLKIKRRESFRPFAPSIHREAVAEFFETDYDVPFMLLVFKIKSEKRPLLPAVTHVDGTGRLQTVTKEQNPRYWRLIDEFKKLTGIPIVLNTSFNENEPIVCQPSEALDCFLRTKMDLLVIQDFIISRTIDNGQ